MLNIGGGEIVVLVILALVILGPSRLPHYAGLLARGVRQLRDLADGAKAQIRQEMGPAFDDVDWRQLDPRQYDPRRIVREALAGPAPGRHTATPGSGSAPALPAAGAQARSVGGTAAWTAPRAVTYDPGLPTPFDPDAT